jgi:hypothetical protein
MCIQVSQKALISFENKKSTTPSMHRHYATIAPNKEHEPKPSENKPYTQLETARKEN